MQRFFHLLAFRHVTLERNQTDGLAVIVAQGCLDGFVPGRTPGHLQQVLDHQLFSGQYPHVFRPELLADFSRIPQLFGGFADDVLDLHAMEVRECLVAQAVDEIFILEEDDVRGGIKYGAQHLPLFVTFRLGRSPLRDIAPH